MLQDICRVSGDWVYIFQQESAPAHRARATVEFLERKTPEFISLLLWPPNSPDLNPVDYSVRSILQGKVYRTSITDLDTSNITSEPSGTSWITPSLLQLFVNGVVFQLVPRQAVVISSTTFNSDIVLCDNCGFEVFVH